MKKIVLLGLLLLTLFGCKSSKTVVSPMPVPKAVEYLSSKLQLTFPTSSGEMTVGGNMKMKGGDRIQLSVLMPFFRTELARIEITPDEVLLVDRMQRRYVRALRSELKDVLPSNARFSTLEKLIRDAALPGGKAELTGEELGIPSLSKAKMQLYDFSSQEFAVTPTEVSDRYTQVPLEELLKMLFEL